MKRCRQCGEIKQEEDFREYYGARKGEARGRYKYCKDCEKINTRHKYLRTKTIRGIATEAEQVEFESIEQLYETLRKLGLQPPVKKEDKTSVMDMVKAMMAKQQEIKAENERIGATIDTPDELKKWLVADLSSYTPDELTDVADMLIKTYKPEIGLDPVSYKQIYDETHREVLNKILERFDDYEDNYEWQD